MEYKLKEFNTQLTVSKIANVHYFEFINRYHTNEDHHDFCELLYVDRGAVTVHSDSYSGILSNGQLMIHRPNEKHFLECDDNINPNVIIIGFECSADELAYFATCPTPLSTDQKRLLSEAMKEGMNVYEPPYDLPNTPEMKKRPQYPFGADQLLKNYLESLLINLVRSVMNPHTDATDSGGATQKTASIYQYLTEHYAEKILLDNLCFLFGTNKTTLCREFKSTYGVTVATYINNLRIEEAKVLLRKNELSVTDISEKIGFSSIHYFCKAFKKTTGQTPREYLGSIRSKLNL